MPPRRHCPSAEPERRLGGTAWARSTKSRTESHSFSASNVSAEAAPRRKIRCPAGPSAAGHTVWSARPPHLQRLPVLVASTDRSPGQAFGGAPAVEPRPQASMTCSQLSSISSRRFRLRSHYPMSVCLQPLLPTSSLDRPSTPSDFLRPPGPDRTARRKLDKPHAVGVVFQQASAMRPAGPAGSCRCRLIPKRVTSQRRCQCLPQPPP